MNKLTTIYFTWHAKCAKPIENLIFDEKPTFDIALFDYSGTTTAHHIGFEFVEWSAQCRLYSKDTDGKGEIISFISKVEADSQTTGYVGFFDDDILIRVSDLNRAIAIGAKMNATSFQPSLARCSHYSHNFTLNRRDGNYHRVNWVEIMMPIVKQKLLLEAAPFLKYSNSSWGIDSYAFPIVTIAEGLPSNHLVIDASIASHIRPISSGEKIYRNGLTAVQEAAQVKMACKQYLLSKSSPRRRLVEHSLVKKLLDL